MPSWLPKKQLALTLATVAFALALFVRPAPARAADSVHPRLLFSPQEIPALQQKVRDGVGLDDTEFTKNISFTNSLLTVSGSSLVGVNYGLYNLLDLGIAYRLALDTDGNKSLYQAKCQEGLQYLTDEYGPIASDPHFSSMRLHVMAIAFDLCFDTLPEGQAPGAVREQIINEMLEYIDPLHQTDSAWDDWWNREYPPYTSNGSVMLGSALGLASIVLRGETDQTATLDSTLAWGQRILEADFENMFDPDGSYTEGELYGPFALRWLIPYVEARQRYDGVNLATRGELQNLDRWFAYAPLPTNDGFHTMANDGNFIYRAVAWNDTYASWAQTEYNSDLARYAWAKTSGVFDYGYQRDRMAMILWHRGAPAADPSRYLPDSMLFRRRGFYYYRTGWPLPNQTETSDSLFTLYAGRFGGGHAHEDQGEFSLYSRRTWFLRDSGYGNTAKQSEAHNLVFIDGAGQHNAGSSIGTDGSMVGAVLNGFADYLMADQTQAYTTYSPLNAPNQPFPGSDWSWGYQGANPVQKAHRHVLVAKESLEAPDYYVMYDDINKDGANHTYDWTFHTESTFSLNTAANPIVVTGSTPDRQLRLYFANPAFGSLGFSSAVFNNASDDPDTLRVRATVAGVANPQFVVILQPGDAATERPSFSSPSGVAGALATQLAWALATDTVYVRQGASVSHAGLTTDAQMLLTRRGPEGELRAFALGQGTSLVEDATTLVTVTGGTASVASSGIEVSISDPALQYTIYAPSATLVTANRTAIPFTKVGDYVYVNVDPGSPLVISNVAAANVTATSATIAWTTNVGAEAMINYGVSILYQVTSSRSSYFLSHSFALTGLQPDTLYHYRVWNTSASGQAASSGDLTFRTAAIPVPDTIPPGTVVDLRP